MTVHIAASLANSSNAVIFADSQASGPTDEDHGMQKLYAGEDYLIGCAGSGMVITRLFQKLHGEVNVNATNVTGYVENFLNNEVAAGARGAISVLAVTPSSGLEPAIQGFEPAVLTHFGARTAFASIGSGSSFVFRALKRDAKNCIGNALTSLPDLVLVAENLAEAATESLTVDDQHLVGLLRNGRTYVLGHLEIKARFLPPALLTTGVWNQVSLDFSEVRAVIATIRAEIRNAQTIANRVYVGAMQNNDGASLQGCSNAIALSRAALAQRLDAYCAWYDQLLGR